MRSLTTKHLAVNRGVDGITSTIVSLIVDGIIGMTLEILINIFGESELPTLSFGMIFMGMFSGALLGIGVMFANISITIGYAGPAYAIAQSSCIIMTFLDWGIMGQVPNGIQIIGLMTSILGAAIIALGDDIIEMYKKRGSNKYKNNSDYKADDTPLME